MGCSALLGVCFLVPASAAAQSMSDAEKIQRLERQTELLQRQSELLQKQLKEVKDDRSPSTPTTWSGSILPATGRSAS
jgi:Tfp pilus assembly protein PilN